MTVSADYLRQGLIRRGLPAHVADAFILNFQDESGLNPGINEIKPIVPGSRGGFGLSQWTGPRRVAYERFAAGRGASLDDPDAQMDFLMTELQGSEARAARSILSAPDTATAAVAIVRDFLRPAPEHLARRSAKYAGAETQTYSAGAQPSQAPQNALAAAPEAPRMVDQRQDVTPFLRQRNALAAQPTIMPQRFNSLARFT